VRLHVLLAVDDTFKRLLAVRAHEGPGIAVYAHVSLHAAVSGERLVTDHTLVVLQSNVCLHVRLQHSAGHKVSRALIALVWLLPCKTYKYLSISAYGWNIPRWDLQTKQASLSRITPLLTRL